MHTCYSPDSKSLPEDIIQRCLEIQINCLAVADHNTISGALELQRSAPFTIIVGEEIRTTYGEIIGFFLHEEIQRHLSPEETVARIKGQGGLVCIPHPFDRFRIRSRLQYSSLKKIMPFVDLIEVFNSRTLMLRDSVRAGLLAQRHGLPGTAGSDAHTVSEIGNSFTELSEFTDAEQFRLALRRGRIQGRRTNPLVHVYNTKNRLIRRIGRR